MVVKVKFYGSLRHLLKEEEVTLSLGDGTLGDVIHELANHLGEGVRGELLDEEGNLDYAYSIFINGERWSNLDAKVREGDEVVITSMLAGG
jgi:molybdopterin converting factor small subunit